MVGKIDSLYICPWSLNDALCQSQSLAYVKELADAGRTFAFMTFEKEVDAIGPTIIHENVTWYPVKWDDGNTLAGKLKGILRVLAKGGGVCLKRRPRLIHSRTSLPSFMAVCLKLLFRCKFLYDADSMLSDEYADTGHLSTQSNGYKFLRWSESWARRHADELIVLTEVLRGIYRRDLSVEKRIGVIPCCVDLSKFQYKKEARNRIRKDLGLSDEPVLIYVGKVGSWYLVEETFTFFKAFLARRPGAKLLIVSTDGPELFDRIAIQQEIGREHYFVRTSRYEKVNEWLSAADAGLSLIKQLPSKLGSSPVKFAEYLSCGLPVVSTSGIGDCDRIINDYDVGVVLPNAEEAGALRLGVDGLDRLLADNTINERCRSAAAKEFDLVRVGNNGYRMIYERLLGNVA
jgi:glycosyltransferase involved in cell wall biosynthesis